MTLETLLHIFSSAKVDDNFYLGRFDWQGVQYRNLNLIGYSCSREFCRHYDGYFHVTGMRFGDELQYPPFNTLFPSKKDELASFYYSKWLACYFLAIRDHMQKHSIKSKKKSLVNILELTIEDFFQSYIDSDQIEGLISESDVEQLRYDVRSKIYYHANSIYREVETDIQLLPVSIWKTIARYVPYRYKSILMFLLKKLSIK